MLTDSLYAGARIDMDGIRGEVESVSSSDALNRCESLTAK
jgi:hypothetical protein